MQKRVLAIHDISCVGKCSLTVALPILSAVGLETSVLPTAVLSTHTGGFTGYAYRDLTEDIMPIVNHWKSLDLKVDAIYTGYLGSYNQLCLMEKIFDTFKRKDTLVLVDPVMADGGVLYSNFTEDFVSGMAELCRRADIIVPNLTEAAFMLKEPYISEGYSKQYVEDLLVRLAEFGPKKVVLSGVSFKKDMLGAAAYDAEAGKFGYYFREKIEGFYPGSGDVFASALLAALMNEKALSAAIEVAVNFSADSIQRTKKAQTDARFGVDFENGLSELIKMIK